MTTQTEPKEYLSCAETAGLLRKALKQSFPTVKFGVRSKVYSGGASIDVSWTDGPRTSAVERISGQFAGANFDGMVDLKTYNAHYLAPNGSPVLAHIGGSGAYIEEADFAPPDVPDVRHVSFGADFVFCSRRITDEETLVEQARRLIMNRCDGITGEGRNAMFGGHWVDDLARGMAYSLDFLTGTTLEDTFREVVLREQA